jgi:hypothetical protein
LYYLKASGLAVLPPGENYTVVGEFRTEVWVNEFLGEPAGPKLFNLTADLSDGPVKDAIAMAIQEKGGTGAIKITIEHRASFTDLLLTALTSSIYAPSLVVITGTVIK